MSARMSYGDWTISQEGFDVRYLGKTESVMSLGTGISAHARQKKNLISVKAEIHLFQEPSTILM